jgi:hypothetical protein
LHRLELEIFKKIPCIGYMDFFLSGSTETLELDQNGTFRLRCDAASHRGRLSDMLNRDSSRMLKVFCNQSPSHPNRSERFPMKSMYRVYERFAALASYLQSPFLLAVRLYWGWQLVQSGWGKLHHLDRVTDYFTSLNLPAPAFTAHFVSGLEWVGGLLLI